MPWSLILKSRFPEREAFAGPGRPEHQRAVAATHYVTRRALRTLHRRYGRRCGWHQHEHEHGERAEEGHAPSVARYQKLMENAGEALFQATSAFASPASSPRRSS